MPVVVVVVLVPVVVVRVPVVVVLVPVMVVLVAEVVVWAELLELESGSTVESVAGDETGGGVLSVCGGGVGGGGGGGVAVGLHRLSISARTPCKEAC